MQMLTNQLQAQNPQAFQQINSLKNNGANAQDILKQIVPKVAPQQLQNILSQAKSMGVPDNVLAQIQNLK